MTIVMTDELIDFYADEFVEKMKKGELRENATFEFYLFLKTFPINNRLKTLKERKERKLKHAEK